MTIPDAKEGDAAADLAASAVVVFPVDDDDDFDNVKASANREQQQQRQQQQQQQQPQITDAEMAVDPAEGGQKEGERCFSQHYLPKKQNLALTVRVGSDLFLFIYLFIYLSI